MGTPTYGQWRIAGQPIANTSGGITLPGQTVAERQLAALAVLVTSTNPDGTQRGT